MNLTMTQRVAKLRDDIANGRIIRGEWVDAKGRVCLMGSLSPEVAEARNASACPADVCPTWWAKLTVFIDDRGGEAKHPAKLERYADLAERWWVLDAAAWVRLDYRCRRIAVLEARSHVAEVNQVLGPIDAVVAMLDRAIAGEMPSDAEWKKATADAAKLAKEAATAEAATALWAAEASWVAVDVESVKAADLAAGVAEAMAWAAAAADRMIEGFFAAMEDEINKARSTSDSVRRPAWVNTERRMT